MTEHHPGLASPTVWKRLVPACAVVPDSIGKENKCPLCQATFADRGRFLDHCAKEQEEIALFCLPHPEESDDDVGLQPRSDSSCSSVDLDQDPDARTEEPTPMQQIRETTASKGSQVLLGTAKHAESALHTVNSDQRNESNAKPFTIEELYKGWAESIDKDDSNLRDFVCLWGGCSASNFLDSDAIEVHLKTTHVAWCKEHATYSCQWLFCDQDGHDFSCVETLENHLISHHLPELRIPDSARFSHLDYSKALRAEEAPEQTNREEAELSNLETGRSDVCKPENEGKKLSRQQILDVGDYYYNIYA